MPQGHVTSIALVTSQAFSLKNFRGPLIRDIVAKGIRCYALAPDFDDKLREEVSALGAEPVDITLQRTSISPLRDMRDLLSLRRSLRRLGPDAVLSYFIKPVIYGSFAARLAGIPRRFCIVEGAGYIFSLGDGDMTTGQRSLRWAIRWLYRFSLRLAERVFFLNPDDLQLFSDELGIIPRSRTVSIPGIGVDLSEYRRQQPVKSPVTFILVARLLAQKGVREFARAARELSRRYPDTRFILVGDVDDNPDSLTGGEIQSWVEEGILDWPGHVDDVRPWLAQSSVVVLPSYYREGLPRSLMEGMAMGRPVITTDMPGCRETVVEGVNGYLVPARNIDALVSAMERFILNPELIESMGLRSRAIAEEHFDVNRINRIILDNMGVSTNSEAGTDVPVSGT